MIRNIIVATLLIFSAVSQPAIASNCDKHSMSIAGQAASTGIFNTLLAAAKATNLTEALYNDGPLTIFALTDEAFSKLPDGTVENPLKNPSELAKVLKYHLVKGNIFSGDLNNGSSVLTVLGSPVSIDTSNGVLVNNARVVTADLEATSGVIHVIDKVLLPTTQHSFAFQTGVKLAGLVLKSHRQKIYLPSHPNFRPGPLKFKRFMLTQATPQAGLVPDLANLSTLFFISFNFKRCSTVLLSYKKLLR